MKYRGEQKGMQVLLNRTQAWPGRAIKQEQEQNSRNHVQAFLFVSVGYVRAVTILTQKSLTLEGIKPLFIV